MHIDIGHVRVSTSEGREFVLIPSLGAMSSIGNPAEIVRAFHELHHPIEARARNAAILVLWSCCADENIADLTGDYEQVGPWPIEEMLIIARHLMTHGICGSAKPGKSGKGAENGDYAEKFDPSEYVDSAIIHLGLVRADAEQLTMTQLQRMIAMKYPDPKKGGNISRDEYKAAMTKLSGAKNG
jgi:hypothetical protein